jgi:hypothetical protein
LKQIFEAIDEELKSNEKHFKRFYFNNTAITELEENTFYEITFEEIYIFNATKLKLINTRAFGATNLVTKIFKVNYINDYTDFPENRTALCDSPPEHDLFFMLSSLVNLETLDISYTNIDAIPSHAFRPSSGNQNHNLRYISFYNNKIKEIGDSPFYYLNNLYYLIFFSNNITSIPKTAFNFKNNFNTRLTLDLMKNNLNGTSFEIGSLNNLKTPTELNLKENPNLTYLDQTIFQPFLDSNVENKVILEEELYKKQTTFDCDDCRNYWLKKDSKYSNRTNLKICSNGKNYTDNDNFSKCK